MRLVKLLSTGACLVLMSGCGRPAGQTAADQHKVREDRDPVKLVAQGKAYFEMGDSLRAQQYFAAAIKSGGDEREIFPHLLRACVAGKNYRLAVDYAEASLAKHPQDARLRFLTGALLGELGDTTRSRERFERAAEELPSDPEVQFTVGVFFRDNAVDVVNADRYFRQYLTLAPQGQHADEARGSLMARVQAPPNARHWHQVASTPVKRAAH
jgi:tetratricopeptide (TPR) repeat protein